MAWVRCCGGSMIKKGIIFFKGVFLNLITGLTARAISDTRFNNPKFTPDYNIINDNIIISATHNGAIRAGSVLSTESIDMTDLSTISIKVDSFTNGYIGLADANEFVITNSIATSYSTAKRVNITGANEYTLDVSNLTGYYYFGICLLNYNEDTNIVISKISYT